jgi:hypothetical protein
VEFDRKMQPGATNIAATWRLLEYHAARDEPCSNLHRSTWIEDLWAGSFDDR